MQKARLIPVSGIGSDIEAEQRATSALLAVLSIVRDLSIDLLSPLGASKAQNATVETFTEVTFNLNGKRIRPDGLIRVSYGMTAWTTLVEVKTRDATLNADQINAYWDIARARAQGFNHVLTISNEIAQISGEHPTSGLKVQANSPVQVSHLSWTAILTTAIRIKQHRGVSDPEQAWILGELIRYLQHESSGALAFEDMGGNWIHVRDSAQSGTLSRKDEAAADIASRFDQLIRYAALILGSRNWGRCHTCPDFLRTKEAFHPTPEPHRDPRRQRDSQRHPSNTQHRRRLRDHSRPPRTATLRCHPRRSPRGSWGEGQDYMVDQPTQRRTRVDCH